MAAVAMEDKKKEMIEKTAQEFQKLNGDNQMFILGYMLGIQQERQRTTPQPQTACGIFFHKSVGWEKAVLLSFMRFRAWMRQKHFWNILTSDIILSKFRKLYLAWIQAMHMKFLENQIT